jgi:photosystem II stability/assembly factor-like uncharacterized protein
MASKSFALTSAGTPSQLYLSEDLGITWASIAPTGLSFADLSQGSVCDVAVGPFNPNEVLITGPAGIRRSTDGGLSFAAASAFPGKHLTYKDSNSIASIADGQIAVSNNGGGTWTILPATPILLFPSTTNPKFDAVYFSNFNAGFIVVNALNTTGDKISRIWKTVNAGTSWTEAIDITDINDYIVSIHANDEEGIVLFLTETAGLYRLDYNLIQDPVLVDANIIGGIGGELRQVGEDPNKIYLITDAANTQKIYYSGDGGYSFIERSAGLFGQTAYPRIFAFDENTIIMLTSVVAGSEAAIYRSEDGGVTLTNQFDNGDGRAIALDSSTSLNCGECPDGFTFNEGANNCEQITLGGTLCNPPYFYDVVTTGCAIADSSTAVNISLAIDISGSVSDDEREQYVIFLKLFIDELLERLATNNTQMAITLWNSVACLQQDWTNDPALLKTAIDAVLRTSSAPPLACPGMSKGGGTQHARALETSVRVLHQGAIDRPAAANFLINVTDGADIGGPCDLSDLGYSIVLPPADQTGGDLCQLLRLTEQIKQNLAGKPSTFMMLAVGTPGDRSVLQSAFKNKSCDGVVIPYPSANDDGDLFYYDAGNFGEANDFAKQLVIGLGAQIIPSNSTCPAGCTAVPGPDSRGYCRCVDTVNFIPCSYKLTDCLDDTITKITDTDLQTYYDSNEIITIQGSVNCWKIEQLNTIEPNTESVIVDEVFPTCNECALAFALINCKDPNVVIYTIQETFLQYIDPDKTIMLEEYPSECWTVRRNTDAQYVPQTLTVKGPAYDSCETCLGARSYLTSCSNNQSVIVTKSDVSQYLNQTVSIVGFPDACFTVLQEACDCIKVRFRTLSDGTRTYILPAHSVKINGRNQYTIVTKSNKRYLIAYDTTEPRWEVWNIDTDTLVAYTPIDAECPYIGYWENVNTETMFGIEPCADAIYDVEIDGTHISCECCLNKNC